VSSSWSRGVFLSQAMVLDRLAHHRGELGDLPGLRQQPVGPRRGSPRPSPLKSAAAVSISRIASGTCCFKRPSTDAVEVRHHVVPRSRPKSPLFRGLMRRCGDDGVAFVLRIRVNACKMSAFVVAPGSSSWGNRSYYAFFRHGR